MFLCISALSETISIIAYNTSLAPNSNPKLLPFYFLAFSNFGLVLNQFWWMLDSVRSPGAAWEPKNGMIFGNFGLESGFGFPKCSSRNTRIL